MTIVSEIKLIRTDTTLDLSQKAEKVCSAQAPDSTLVGLDPWAGRYEFKQTISFFWSSALETQHGKQQKTSTNDSNTVKS